MIFSDLKHLFKIAKYPLLFLAICWLVFYADSNYHLYLYSYGVSPRTLSGLKGILFSPFIHADLNHILNNSLPILILGSMIFYFYKSIAWSSIVWVYFISGLWLWIGGRNSDQTNFYHFGASTLIYGFATFLFFSGVFRKHKPLMVVSALVVLLYGSITWGLFPFDESISWEGHLFGAISGLLVAYSYRKEGPQKEPFIWSEIDNVGLAYLGIEEEDLKTPTDISSEEVTETKTNNLLDSVQVIYHYKASNATIHTQVDETESSEK